MVLVRSGKLPEFTQWFEELSPKACAQIDARLLRISEHGHFGDAKYLGDGLAEWRWKSGWRIYSSRMEDPLDHTVLLIRGGTKYGQDQDIAKARVLLRRYASGAP